MLRPDLGKQKIKRILLAYRELERLKLTHEASMDFMEYMFNVSPRWMEEILRQHDLSEMGTIDLKHQDLDIIMIDKYVNKVRRSAQSDRKSQLALF